MTLYSIIEDSASKWPDKTAIINGRRKYTYSRVKYLVDRQIKMLWERNITGRNILLQFENSVEFVIAFFSAACSRNTAVLCDIKLNRELENIITENGVALVLVSPTQLNSFQKKLGSFNAMSLLEVQPLSINAGELCNSPDNTFEIDTGSLSTSTDAALILYTSGSASFPKGVVNTHQNMMEALSNYMETIFAGSDDVFMGVSPFLHSYALGSCLLASMRSGACLIIQPRFDVKGCLKSISNEKVTIFHGVPYMYDLFTRQLNFDKYDLSSVRLFISAGMKLDEEVFDSFYKLTSKIIRQEYGSTETGAVLLNLSSDLNMAKASAGRPLKGVSISIDSGGAAGGRGVLIIQSKGCGRSYVGKEPFDKACYRTSDIALINEEGYVFIHGRTDRLINIEGKKVDPGEVEKVLHKHPHVENASVYPVQDSKRQVIGADIILNEDEGCGIDEIKRFCSDYLSAYKVPRIINICKELPESSLGKRCHYMMRKEGEGFE